MPDKLVTRGLVLRATETKEADYILTVLTAEHGRLAVIARGAVAKIAERITGIRKQLPEKIVLHRKPPRCA